MGVQTEVVIADKDEAQAIADTDGPAAHWTGFRFNGFDRVQLCTLLSIIKGVGPETEFDHYLDQIEIVSASTEDWPVVSVVPSKMVAELTTVAGLETTEFNELAKTWAATEEFAGWSGSDVQILLRELTDLAESASLQDQCLMVWQTL